MAVGMIGGPQLYEPLFTTDLGRFTSAASRHGRWFLGEELGL